MRNSKIILCSGILIDKEYKNVLNYTEQEMLNLVNSKKLIQDDHYSFIRENGTILVNFNYETCLKANYMAYQNPDYSNKWFFAWITKVSYKNNGTTELSFVVDTWSTWFSTATKKKCFVIREHVNNDAVGANTVPEGLETGDYISTDANIDYVIMPTPVFVLCTTNKIPFAVTYANSNQKIPSGLYYNAFTTMKGMLDVIDVMENQGLAEQITSVFVSYDVLFTDWVQLARWDHEEYGRLSTHCVWENNIYQTANIPTKLGENYTPVNKKLLTYPFSFLQVSNNSGQVINYKWENFNKRDPLNANKTFVSFKMLNTCTPGGSGRMYPEDYNNRINDYDDGITLGKVPVGSFNTDAYTNWLTQNSLNVGLNLLQGGINIASGNIMGGTMGIANSVASVYQHSFMPNNVEGNTNCGDVNFQFDLHIPCFKNMSIKNEYARIIDDYFTMFGYKVNRLKQPNVTGRKEWNYVQIAEGERWFYGNMPTQYVDALNEIAVNGTTIWHNHDHVGNFDLDNSIQA